MSINPFGLVMEETTANQVVKAAVNFRDAKRAVDEATLRIGKELKEQFSGDVAAAMEALEKRADYRELIEHEMDAEKKLKQTAFCLGVKSDSEVV